MMTPEEIDRRAESMKQGIRRKVQETGRMVLGANLLITRNPFTGAELAQEAWMPILIDDMDGPNADLALIDLVKDVSPKVGAVCCLYFNRVYIENGQGGADIEIMIAYDRIHLPMVKFYAAKISKVDGTTTVGEYREIGSEHTGIKTGLKILQHEPPTPEAQSPDRSSN